jgi:hypothetical protein
MTSTGTSAAPAAGRPRTRAPLPEAARLYVAAVIAAGGLALIAFAPREYPQPALALTCLAAMVMASLFKLRLPLGVGQSTMSMAYVIDFTVLVTAGADLAMVIAAAGVLVQCTVRVRRAQPWYRTAFSVATVALAVQAAGWTWSALGGTIVDPGVMRTAAPLGAAAGMYFVVNSGLVAAAIAFSNGLSLARCWRQGFIPVAPGYLAAAGVVATTGIMMTTEAYVLLSAAAAPMVIGHLAYALWFRHLADRRPVPA